MLQQITGVPPEGLTAEEIEKMRTKFGINFKFSKFVLGNSGAYVSRVLNGDYDVERLETPLGGLLSGEYNGCMFLCSSQEGHEIEELEKQVEVQTAIIEATKSLVDQAKNRQIKKDRKKEVKMAEDKVHAAH